MGLSKKLNDQPWQQRHQGGIFPDFLKLPPKAQAYLAKLRKNLQKKRTPLSASAKVS
jgi:hypothetical protein